MPPSDPVEILLAHDRWATGQILDSCTELSHEQFHREFEMGPGSLHNSLNHILGAMQAWSDLLEGRERRPRLETVERTVSEMRELLEVLADGLADTCKSHPDTAEICSGSRNGRTFTFTRGAILTHLTTHGMHHRAQCLNMLRQLGIQELPPSSVLQWYWAVEPPE